MRSPAPVATMTGNRTIMQNASPLAHLSPAVVVRIGNHDSGKKKEEIDSQVAVVQNLFRVIPIGIDFAGVEHYDDQGSYATQTVEDLVVALGLKGGGSFVHGVPTVWLVITTLFIFFALSLYFSLKRE
jgi:hypothetical protein